MWIIDAFIKAPSKQKGMCLSRMRELMLRIFCCRKPTPHIDEEHSLINSESPSDSPDTLEDQASPGFDNSSLKLALSIPLQDLGQPPDTASEAAS